LFRHGVERERSRSNTLLCLLRPLWFSGVRSRYSYPDCRSTVPGMRAMSGQGDNPAGHFFESSVDFTQPVRALAEQGVKAANPTGESP